MRITHIDHYNIRLKPSDLKAIRDFYVNVIGLTEGARPYFKFPGYWLYGGAEAARTSRRYFAGQADRPVRSHRAQSFGRHECARTAQFCWCAI
jgi:catechol 2,3-dioxygenase-like lactoylglutathione lyase family enzyme